MKTVMIYDQLDAELKFFVLEGDLTHLDGVYINQWIESDSKAERKKRDALQNELNTVIYDETNGTFLHPVESKFPIQAVVEGAVVVVAGFLP